MILLHPVNDWSSTTKVLSGSWIKHMVWITWDVVIITLYIIKDMCNIYYRLPALTAPHIQEYHPWSWTSYFSAANHSQPCFCLHPFDLFSMPQHPLSTVITALKWIFFDVFLWCLVNRLDVICLNIRNFYKNFSPKKKNT